MSSETERITHAVMDKHNLDKLAEHPGGALFRRAEGHLREAISSFLTCDESVKIEIPDRENAV
jgi:hypothetical protein